MKKLSVLLIIGLTFYSCAKDQATLKVNDQFSWICGEGAESVWREFSQPKGNQLQLSLQSEGFCAQANGIEVLITQAGQTLVQDTFLSFPQTINFEIPKDGNIQIRTKVVVGPAFILCARLGKVEVSLAL